MLDETGFAVVAYRVEGDWEVGRLPARTATDLPTLLTTVRQLPSEGGVLALVSGEEAFVVARVDGPAAPPRLLLSDSWAADDSDLAAEVIDELGLEAVDPADEDDEGGPIGDLALLADLGVPADDLEDLCDDDELWPDEALSAVARRLGFGRQFDEAVGAAVR